MRNRRACIFDSPSIRRLTVMHPVEPRLSRYPTAEPNSAPTPAVIAIASAPQNVTRHAPARSGAPPVRAASAPRLARKTSELAATIASKSPVSTRMGKHTLNVIEDMTLRDGYRYEQDMTALIGKSDDAKEAQRAFAEKRAPVFTGR